MIEQYTSPAVVNNSQEPWLVGEGVSLSGSIAIPSLDFNFVTNAFPGTVTFTRASTATYFDSAGVLQSAAIDVPRLDYDPATLAARGFLVEEQRTNSIRNNTGVGAVAGTPGTLPTNWDAFDAALELTFAIAGVGTENGINYVDIRVSGTVSAQRNGLIFFDQSTIIAASAGQSWTESLYIKLQAGSTANIEQINLRTDYYSSVPAFVGTSISSAITVTSAALNTQRQTSLVITPVSTAFVQPGLRIRTDASGAIDITLRIGLPQLELGAFATSVIPTTTTALTRSADVAAVNTLSPWFNGTETTLYVEAVTPPNLAGFPAVTTFNDGSTQNLIMHYLFTNGYYAGVRSGNIDQGNAARLTAPVVGNIYKFAAGIAFNNANGAANGLIGIANTSLLMPIGLSQMRIGANATGGTVSNTWIRRITYYPRRLSNAELQAITA